RGRRDRRGRRHGDPHLRRVGDRDADVHERRVVAGSPHAGLARHEQGLIRRHMMDRDRILLTPGPLTTTLRTKLAMLRDWGSWDTAFIDLTAELRRQLLAVVHGDGSHVVVPLQGSGTFSVEAAVATVVPKNGHALVLDNG